MPQEKIAELVQQFTELLEHAQNREELASLIELLLTPSEIEGVLQRWKLMNLLIEGVPQREIMSRLGICLGKISRGSRLLKYENPEYCNLIKRINSEIEDNNSNSKSN